MISLNRKLNKYLGLAKVGFDNPINFFNLYNMHILSCGVMNPIAHILYEKCTYIPYDTETFYADFIKYIENTESRKELKLIKEAAQKINWEY